VRLESHATSSKGPILSSDPSPCFIIDVYLGPKNHKVFALLDSGASACFIDEDFVKNQKITLVKKTKPVHVEVIDGRSLISGDITHETIPLDIVIKDHTSIVTFNVIKSPSNPIILELSWLEKYNPQIDWKSRNLDFSSSSIQNSISQVETYKPNISKPLLVGTRAFVHIAKEGTPFAIYATSIGDAEKTSSGIPSRYQDFQDVFEKKNADILPKHRPYDCTIDLH